jgi:HlyD family secretion protein
LNKDGAATQKQLDDAEARVRTIRRKIDALQTQKQSVRAEVAATEAKIAQLDDQIEDATITNPVRGTVLTTFVEPHELLQKGQPLYRIANLDTLILRVFVSGAQLPGVKLGQDVEVLVDKNAQENQALIGQVSWIASQAEFTPQQIQTKEERVSQVYAVKVRVPNPDGILKIGMPGEVNFTR